MSVEETKPAATATNTMNLDISMIESASTAVSGIENGYFTKQTLGN